MRVLYLDQTGQLGGGEIALLPWLAHTRASVLLFADGPFRTRLEQAGVTVQVLPLGGLARVRRDSGPRALLAVLPRLAHAYGRLRLATRDCDVLYANSMKAFIAAALVRRRRQRVVWHLRDILTAQHFSPLLRRVAVRAADLRADAVLANSQATADALREAGCRVPATVVHDGVSAAPFHRRRRDDPPAGNPASATVAGKVVIGCFSRLSPWKGQHVLLEAASTLPQVEVWLAGEALFGESAYAVALQARAAQPDLAGRVRFLGFCDNVPRVLRSVDLVAHTSTAPEPFGLVIVEGMLAGKPVIATRAGGAIEILGEDEEGGLLVTPGSVDALRAVIVRLLADPAGAHALAAAGKARALRLFSLERMFDGIAAVLHALDRNDAPKAGQASAHAQAAQACVPALDGR